jgi:hypothetical protein
MSERWSRRLERDEYLALSEADRQDYEAFEFIRSRKDHAVRSMAYWDKQPPQVRELVHEVGAGVVQAFVSHGITDPRKIRLITCAILGIQPETGGVGNRGNRGKSQRHIERFHEMRSLPSRYRP